MDFSSLIERLGDASTSALFGFLIGLSFGIFAQKSKFCLRAAAVEFAHGTFGSRLEQIPILQNRNFALGYCRCSIFFDEPVSTSLENAGARVRSHVLKVAFRPDIPLKVGRWLDWPNLGTPIENGSLLTRASTRLTLQIATGFAGSILTKGAYFRSSSRSKYAPPSDRLAKRSLRRTRNPRAVRNATSSSSCTHPR